MGVDIHVYMERKVNGKWEYGGLYDRYYKSSYDYDTRTFIKDVEAVLEPVSIYTGRNYDLFSILSNCSRGSFNCSVPEYGKPSDMSEEVYNLTLDEETGKPASYYYNFNTLTLNELDKVAETLFLLRKNGKKNKAMWKCFRHFYEIVSNAAYQSKETFECSFDNVRIVYWFDC